jgi:hypothetical protein
MNSTIYEFIKICIFKKNNYIRPELSDFLLALNQSLAHQRLAKILDIPKGMPVVFANLAASRSWHISSQ